MARYGRGQPQPPILLRGPIPETVAVEVPPRATVVQSGGRWFAGSVTSQHGPIPEEVVGASPRQPTVTLAPSAYPKSKLILLRGPTPETVVVPPPHGVVVLAESRLVNGAVLALRGPIPEPIVEALPRRPAILLVPSPYPKIQPAFVQHGPAPFSAGPSVVARWFAYRRATWKALPRITWQAQRRVVWRWQPQMVQTLSGFKQLRQATWETKDYTYDLSGYMPTAVSVSSATATLISPAGATQPVTPTLSNNDQAVRAVVTCRVTVAMLAGETGLWKLDVKPTLSNGEIADGARFEIEVDF